MTEQPANVTEQMEQSKTGTITPLKMHKRGWEILARTSIGNNLLPVCAELLTNATDSYARLMKSGKLSKSATKPIDIIYVPGEEGKKEGFFSITDQAEGMTAKEIEERLTKYGKSTIGQAPRGLFGFG